MRSLLNQFVELYKDDKFRRSLEEYERALKTFQWEFVRDTFLTIKGDILIEMLSNRFTKLDAEEKDVQQRAYFYVVQLLEYLMAPTKYIRHQGRFKETEQRRQRKADARKGVV